MSDNVRAMNESAQLAPHTHRVTLLIAIAGVVVAGYALWRNDNTRDREDDTRERVQQLETANASLRAQLTAAADADAKLRVELQKQWQQLGELPQRVRDLAASYEDLRARTERPQRAWSRAEALYLVELAQRRLSFDRDTATAIAALESADARLASLRDMSLAAIRERIAKDLQALRAVPEPDRTGIMARLAGIESQITRLPVKGVLIGQRTAPSATESDSIFGRAWNALARAFGTLFVVRRVHDGSIVSLEEQSLRRQYLSLLAFSARHAVLRSDREAFAAALGGMRNWIAQYFTESPAATAILQELVVMQKIDVAPPLPDISAAALLLTRAAPPVP
jgi:uroporphyrin-III C-methyltransferase